MRTLNSRHCSTWQACAKNQHAAQFAARKLWIAFVASAFLIVLALGTVARAQPCGWPQANGFPPVPGYSSSCDSAIWPGFPAGAFPLPPLTPYPNSSPSMCWGSVTAAEQLFCNNTLTAPPPGFATFQGFPLNLDLWVGPTMGDYPPLKLGLAESSSPLVAAEASHYYLSPSAFLERQTAGGYVDLISGSPLLQAIDLELPFGSATFRHLRTYSEPTDLGKHEHSCVDDTLNNGGNSGMPRERGSHLYWDWNGQGWMIGENPILLIDSAYWGCDDRFDYSTAQEENFQRRRCYFIPDAHHAIPFEMIDATVSTQPKYVAPPRFDAVLSYDGGVWDTANLRWTTPPTAWYVWLHNQSVKYTILPRYEDVGYTFIAGTPPQPVSMHDTFRGPNLSQPVNPHGWGVPYYGLTTQIEDRYGNRVVIDHCAQRQRDCGSTTEPPCNFCCQNCNEKGQIRSIKLYAAGQTTAQWTLVYVYREFQDENPYGYGTNPWQTYGHHRQQAIQSIYAYRGDQALNVPSDACFSIPHSVFQGIVDDAQSGLPTTSAGRTVEVARDVLHSLDSVDAFSVPSVGLPSALADTWVYQVRYLYTDNTRIFHESAEYDPIDLFGENHASRRESPRLIKATSIHRPVATVGTSSSTAQEYNTLYRYVNTPSGAQSAPHFDTMSLRYTWGNDQLEAVRRGIQATAPTSDLLPNWPMALLMSGSTQELPVTNAAAQANPTLPAHRQATLDSLATLGMSRWGQTPNFGSYGSLGTSDFIEEMINNYILTIEDRSRLHMLPTGTFVLSTKRGSPDDGAYQKIYRFMVFPTIPSGATRYPFGHARSANGTTTLFHQVEGGGMNGGPYRGLIHHPYLYNRSGDSDGNVVEATDIVPPSEPLWVTVVDGYDDPKGLKWEPIEEQTPNSDNYYPTIADMLGYRRDPRLPVMRRVVVMNAAGYVMDEAVWAFRDGWSNSIGLGERYILDNESRIVERRTASWRAADHDGHGDTRGLVHKYLYEDQPNANPPVFGKSASAIGVSEGIPSASNPVFWQKQYIHGVTDRPDLLTHEIEFLTPTTSLFSTPPTSSTASYSVAINEYELAPAASGAPPATRKLLRKRSLLPGTAIGPAGPVMLPFNEEAYDSKGNTAWRAYGMLESPAVYNGSSDLVYVDRMSYDTDGRLVVQIVDSADSAVVDAVNSPARHAPSPPLGRTTSFEYTGSKLTKRTYPNGRVDVHTYTEWTSGQNTGNMVQYLQHRVYKDLLPNEGWRFLSPGEVSITQWAPNDAENSFSKEMLVQWDPLSAQPDGDEAYTTLVELTPTFDAGGRLIKMSIDGSDGENLSMSAITDNLGEIMRERRPDGGLTRYVNDPIGRRLKTYTGTKDLHQYWRTAAPSGTNDDNMILVERRFYGEGAKDFNPGDGSAPDYGDAARIIEVRKYRQKPTNQYPTNTTSSNEDDIGWSEVHRYDWRGRDVWTTQYASGATPISKNNEAQNWPTALRHSLTWLDHNDRPRFVAIFADVSGLASWNKNPTALHASDALPTASDIIQAGAIRLTETIYNARGQVEHIREYNTAVSNGTSYLLTETYYDQGNRAVWTRSPNTGITIVTYDSQGAEISRALCTLSGSPATLVQQTRTDTTRDADANPLQVTSWERRHNASTGATLDSSNAIATYVFNWFDAKNRLVASAATGTGQSTFTYGAAPSHPPATYSPVRFNATTGEFSGFDWDSVNTGNQTPPTGVEITGQHYDLKGQKDWSVGPNQAITAYKYNGLGVLVAMTENATASSYIDRRITAYKYELGRLTKMGAVLNGDIDPVWENGAGSQVTQVKYMAPVYDASTGQEISKSASLPVSVHFPSLSSGSTSGAASTAANLAFTYYPDGLLRSRTDERGITFKHTYDEQGNRIQTDIDYTNAQYPLNLVPEDMARKLEYTYDPASGDLRSATASFPIDQNTFSIISHNKFDYDNCGNLQWEKQQHGAPVSTNSPKVAYSRTYEPHDAGNRERLLSMAYPTHSPAPMNAVSFTYGTPGSADDQLGRITTVNSTRVGGDAAQYEYTGMSRAVITKLGVGSSTTAVVQSFADPAGTNNTTGYAGLDGRGRPIDIHSRQASTTGSTIHEARHGYDASGNRIWSWIKHGMASANENHRSWHYAYDNLERLVSADVGELQDPQNYPTPILTTTNAVQTPRRSSWTHDSLGNWLGTPSGVSPAEPGLKVEGPLGTSGAAATHKFTHSTNAMNQLLSLGLNEGGGTVNTLFVHDLSGNLVADAGYFYQYDGFNRLVAVHRRGSLVFDAAGDVDSGTAGAEIAFFTYDALGRLIRKLSPFPGVSSTYRAEHYYYDGIRRVQEVLTDPIPNYSPFGVAEEDDASPTTWLDREYVYSPGGGGSGVGGPAAPGYVDSYICQIDAVGRIAYVVQDAGYTPVALVAGNGASGGSYTPGTLIERYTFDPYGVLLEVTQGTATFGASKIGHQGLFLDRLDANCLQPTLAAGRPGAAPNSSGTSGGSGSAYGGLAGGPAIGVYHNRNRTYAAHLGNFLQRDPNASGQPSVAEPDLHHGRAATQPALYTELASTYSDGMSYYNYQGSNPTTRTDPLGLSWDPFDVADEIGLEHRFSGLVALAKLDSFFRDKQVLRKIRAYERGAFEMMDVFWDRDVGILFSMVGSPFLAHMCFVEGTPVATRAGVVPIESLKLGDVVVSLPDHTSGQTLAVGLSAESVPHSVITMQYIHVDGSITMMRLLRPTHVVTSTGIDAGSRVWIELDELGISGEAEVIDVVLSPVDACPGQPMITGLFKTDRARILNLYVGSEPDPIGLTPQHPIYSEDRCRWVASGSLLAGETVRTMTGTAIVARRAEPSGVRTVYNIEVSPYHTYFVGASAVWVHNPCQIGGGAKSGNISPGKAAALQSAANKYRTEITLVGSRASKTADILSDWDLLVPAGTPARVIQSIKWRLRDALGRNIEVFRAVLDSTRPFMRFLPDE
ncbi:MAG: polymorphic toxin-type HINT domain-containing protein [Phycisphaerales bacterium]